MTVKAIAYDVHQFHIHQIYIYMGIGMEAMMCTRWNGNFSLDEIMRIAIMSDR